MNKGEVFRDGVGYETRRTPKSHADPRLHHYVVGTGSGGCLLMVILMFLVSHALRKTVATP